MFIEPLSQTKLWQLRRSGMFGFVKRHIALLQS